jgi:hypothetical protein
MQEYNNYDEILLAQLTQPLTHALSHSGTQSLTLSLFRNSMPYLLAEYFVYDMTNNCIFYDMYRFIHPFILYIVGCELFIASV